MLSRRILNDDLLTFYDLRQEESCARARRLFFVVCRVLNVRTRLLGVRIPEVKYRRDVVQREEDTNTHKHTHKRIYMISGFFHVCMYI